MFGPKNASVSLLCYLLIINQQKQPPRRRLLKIVSTELGWELNHQPSAHGRRENDALIHDDHHIVQVIIKLRKPLEKDQVDKALASGSAGSEFDSE